MMDSETHRALAAELDQAKNTRQQIRQFTQRYPDMSVTDSYAIQRQWTALQLQQGRTAIGHKIGLTSRAMQLASQITEPDYGTLLDDMLLRDGEEVDASRFIVPRFEVEFAFILAKPLMGPAVTMVDVLNATDYVIAALELIDARIEQFDRKPGSRARFATPLPTMPPTPASSWATALSSRMNSICAGPVPCCSRTV